MTKLDFDKEATPGPKHYEAPDDIREPLVQDKLPDKEEEQVPRPRNHCYCSLMSEVFMKFAQELNQTIHHFWPLSSD